MWCAAMRLIKRTKIVLYADQQLAPLVSAFDCLSEAYQVKLVHVVSVTGLM